ncbi:MAG: hypothetical protein ACI3Y2_01045 [Candidatus Egerieousia sp.]
MALERFEGKEVVIGSPSYVLFSSFSDLRNFVSKIPSEYRDKVTVTEDSVSGNYSGMDMGLKIVEKLPNSKIVMKPQGGFPLDFSLILNFNEVSPSQTGVKVSIESEMNFMVKAMFGKKIKEMVDKISSNLEETVSRGGAM